MGKKFVGLDGLKHFWSKAKTWILEQITAEVTAKIAELVANAPEDLDTLKEIADWISAHADSASAMNTQIQANAEAIAGKADKVHTHTKSDITDLGNILLDKQSIIDAVYPVGSLYWSSKSTSPATLFGGTWEQIKDKFVLAAGSTYTAGTTGGASTVTLSVSNMPSHNHTFTPSGTIKMNSHSHGLNNHTHSFSGRTDSSGKHKHGPSNNLYNSYRPDGGSDSGNGLNYLSYYPNNPHWYSSSGANNDTKVANENNSSVNTSTTSVSPHLTGYAGYHSHGFSGTTGGNSGNTTSTTSTGSFSGTQGTTSSNGSGTAFSILPPYVVKYCWERTA